MNTIMTPEAPKVAGLYHRPSVSIVMPLEAKVSLKIKSPLSLKSITDKVDKELLKNYPVETCSILTEKLKKTILNLSSDIHQKKGIAIYISLSFEKVLYLDTAVNEKISVDDPFGIIDLAYNMAPIDHYLAILLSSNKTQIFLINSNRSAGVAPRAPELIYAYVNCDSKTTGNTPDKSKQILNYKQLRHIDSALEEIMQTYPLPILALGLEKTLYHFKSLTKHRELMLDYLHGNYEDKTFMQLKDILQGHVASMHQKRKSELLNVIEAEAHQSASINTINNIGEEESKHHWRLSPAEKNDGYTANHLKPDPITNQIMESDDRYPATRHIVQ